jgi:hypothetical protein
LQVGPFGPRLDLGHQLSLNTVFKSGSQRFGWSNAQCNGKEFLARTFVAAQLTANAFLGVLGILVYDADDIDFILEFRWLRNGCLVKNER